jgi:hypothetical protein
MANEKKAPKAKTVCPISKARFMEKAAPLKVSVAEQGLIGTPKEFSTGSYGWYITGKVAVVVDGVTVMAQFGGQATLIGSKPGNE